MVRRCLLPIITAACSAPATSTPTAPPKPVAPAPAPAPFTATPVSYAAPVVQPVRRYCPPSLAPVPAPAGGDKTKRYDFGPIAIDARLGATASTQPRSSFARDPEAIRAAIQRAEPRMSECLRVARTAGLRTRMDLLDAFVELEVDPFGAIGNVTVDAPKPLDGCLQAALAGVRVRRQTSRITHATVRIDFSHLSSAAPLKTLPAAPPPAAASGHCFLAPDPLPTDEPTLTPVAIDFAPSPPASRRSWRGNACRPIDVDKAQIRRAVLAVHGDLRTCYLDALGRQPELQGTVDTQYVIGPDGQLANVTVTGAGDDALHTCLADVLASTAAASIPSSPILVNMPFALTRSTTGFDREAAAKSAVERVRTASTADAACRARIALLDAYRGVDPAGGPVVAIALDPRLMPELESLSAFVAANPGPVLAGCLDELAPTLVDLGRFPVRNDEPERMLAARGNGLAEAIERSQRIVELFPHVERRLLLFIGDGLAMLDRHDEARDAYLRFITLGGEDREALERAADSYARVTRNRDDGLLWDDCPR